MGERQEQPFQLSFDTSLKADFQGSRGQFRWWLDPCEGVGRAFGLR
jgi:hypothetical protein